jgi:hypothetical protein
VKSYKTFFGEIFQVLFKKDCVISAEKLSQPGLTFQDEWSTLKWLAASFT